MYHFYDVVINDKTGVPLPDVQIRVYDDLGVIVPLFADEAGSVPIESITGIANTAITDAAGNYDFYIADGTYDIRFFVGDAVLKVLPNILMGFPDVAGKAQASAIGISGGDSDLGIMSDALIADYLSVKDALKSISSSLLGTTAITGSGAIGYNILAAYDANTLGFELQYRVNVRNFGAAGDGVNDDYAAFQAAYSFLQLFPRSRTIYVPSTDKGYRLTQTLNFENSVCLVGEYGEPYAGNNGPSGTQGSGSWLEFDHLDTGINFGNGTPISGVEVRGICFRRPMQPAPGSTAWEPLDHGYDIVLNSADAVLDTLMFLGTSRGIRAYNGNYGRLTANNIFGHFFKEGMNIDKQYDLCMISNFRAWPYWAGNSHVSDYTLENLNTIVLGRVDNPILHNIFSIAHAKGILIDRTNDEGGYPGGSVSKGKFTNIDMDAGTVGIYITPNVVTCDVDIANFSMQGGSSTSISHAIQIEGSNARIGISNYDARNLKGNAIRCTGVTGSSITLTGRVLVDGYNMQPSSSFPAFELSSGGNVLNMATWPTIANGNGAPAYGGGGTFNTLSALAADLTAIQTTLTSQGNDIAKLNTDMGLSVATVWATGSGAAAANKAALVSLAATADAQKKPIHIPPGEWYCDGGMSIPYVPIICDGIIYTNTTTAWLTFTNSAADVNGFYLRGGKFINTNGTTAQKDSRVYRFQATNGKLIDSGYIERIDAYGFYAVCENDCDTFTSSFGQESLMNNFRTSQVRNSWRGALNAKYVFLHKRGSGTGWIYADCLENLAVGSTLPSQPDSAYWDVYGSETMGIPAYVRVESGGVNAVCGDITVEGDLTGRQTAMISIDGNCNYQTKVKLSGQVDAQARYTSVQDPSVAGRNFIAFDERVLGGGISDLRKYAAIYLQSMLETKVQKANLAGRFDPVSAGAKVLEVAKIKCANGFGPLVTISASGLVQGSAFGRRRQVFSIRWNGSAFEVLEIASLGFTHPASVNADFFLFTASVSGDTVTFFLNMNGSSEGSYAEVMIQTEEGWSLMTRGPSLQ